MYEVELAVFGAFAGLFTPISIYVAKKLVDPVFGLREFISKISFSLTFYANVYSNPGNSPRHQEVSEILRKHASDLISKYYLVKYHRIPTYLGLIPSKSDVESAQRELIGMSNMLFRQEYVTRVYNSEQNVRKLLKM